MQQKALTRVSNKLPFCELHCLESLLSSCSGIRTSGRTSKSRHCRRSKKHRLMKLARFPSRILVCSALRPSSAAWRCPQGLSKPPSSSGSAFLHPSPGSTNHQVPFQSRDLLNVSWASSLDSLQGSEKPHQRAIAGAGISVRDFSTGAHGPGREASCWLR